MTNVSFSFGEMRVFGEIARGVHPADEVGLAMALALGQPDDPAPPFATVPVWRGNTHLGFLHRINYVWGGSSYEFRSLSGNTVICSLHKDEVLQRLKEVLGLSS
jgi:hypothetical protein